MDAAHRRLREEMGFDCELKEAGQFLYEKKFNNGLAEREYDHVLIGRYDHDPIINKEEADAFKWMSLPQIRQDVNQNPEDYTYWFKEIIKKMLKNPPDLGF